MLVTCPHCYVRVLPTEDGTCPACRERIEAGASASWELFAIRDGEELPDFCYRCGVETTRRVDASKERTVRGESLLVVALAAVFTGLRSLAQMSDDQVLGQHQRVRVSMPACDEHATPPPEPNHVNFERGTAAYDVAPTFANRVRAKRVEAEALSELPPR